MNYKKMFFLMFNWLSLSCPVPRESVEKLWLEAQTDPEKQAQVTELCQQYPHWGRSWLWGVQELARLNIGQFRLFEDNNLELEELCISPNSQSIAFRRQQDQTIYILHPLTGKLQFFTEACMADLSFHALDALATTCLCSCGWIEKESGINDIAWVGNDEIAYITTSDYRESDSLTTGKLWKKFNVATLQIVETRFLETGPWLTSQDSSPKEFFNTTFSDLSLPAIGLSRTAFTAVVPKVLTPYERQKPELFKVLKRAGFEIRQFSEIKGFIQSPCKRIVAVNIGEQVIFFVTKNFVTTTSFSRSF